MLGMTGFSDYRELCSVLFQTLAMLEMQGQACLEVDQVLTKKIVTGQ